MEVSGRVMFRMTVPHSYAFKEASLTVAERKRFENELKVRLKRVIEIETRIFLAEQRMMRDE